jgi:glucosyl-dolichyl phosphate glucuronosyltransferase
MDMVSISVIIATYNRCESLRKTLNSICDQELDNVADYEIIVIDNNSNDDTKTVVESYRAKIKGGLKYVFEGNQGLSYARNKGIENANGEIIAFIDDDVIVEKGWLFNVWKCFKDYHCDGLGGRVLPAYPDKTPIWIKANSKLLNGPIVYHDYGDEVIIYERNTMFPAVGANMAYRKPCFAEGNMFRRELGAGQGVVGEDTEFFRRMERGGKKLVYCGKALVWHAVDEKRMNLKYIAKWNISAGKYSVRNCNKEEVNEFVFLFSMPRHIIREVIENAIKVGVFVFNRRKLLTYWQLLFTNIGQLIEWRNRQTCQK